MQLTMLVLTASFVVSSPPVAGTCLVKELDYF
jgi:hypothetical protein